MKEETGEELLRSVLTMTRKHGLDEHLLRTPLVVGVSGGADSLAMLHLLRTLRGEDAQNTLHVAHLNHWVRAKEAQEDADFVQQMAHLWGLPCTVGQFDVPNYARRHKLSVEDAARRARYAFFASVAQPRGATVAVAHNADDQAETVLMSILRGTGLRGLAGMQMLGQTHLPAADQALNAFAGYEPASPVSLFRPLLGVWRWQILNYCKQAGLEPRWDSTNWERRYRRNRIRHDLIPLLQMQYSLAIKDHLYNLSQIAQGDDEWLNAHSSEALSSLSSADPWSGEINLTLAEFALLPKGAQRRVVREALQSVAGTERDFTFRQVEAASAILAGDPNSPSAMHLPNGLVVGRSGLMGYVARREDHGRGLEVAQMTDHPLVEEKWEANFEPDMEMDAGSGWHVESAVLSESWPSPESLGDDGLAAMFDLRELGALHKLVWRTRSPGDFIQPMGMKGSKSLQDVMVDAKIPRGQRQHVAVLAIAGGNEVLWIPGKGGRRSIRAPVSERTTAVVLVKWEMRHT